MIRASEMRLAQTAATPADKAEILNILSVAELKREVRRTDASEDDKFEDAIYDAYYRLDGPLGWLNRAILEQQWVGVIDGFDDVIEIPLPPLVTVDQIRYRDTSGAWQVLSTDTYTVSTYGLVGSVQKVDRNGWPEVDKNADPVEIAFTCGFGSGADVVANFQGFRRALKLLAGHYFHTPLPTFSEPRVLEVPRKVQYALDFAIRQLGIVNDHS